MKKTLIFTALPHRVSEQDGKKMLMLSVVATIRLHTPGTSKLSKAKDVRVWPQHIMNASWTIRFNNVEIPATLQQEKIDAALWDKLMHDDIRVKGFETEDLTQYRLVSYPVRHVHDFVVDNYKKFAVTHPSNALEIGQFLDTNGLAAISRYRPLGDDAYKKLKETPRRTELTEAEIFNSLKIDRRRIEKALGLKKGSKFIPFRDQPDPATDFLQFRDFHQVDKKPLKAPPPKLKKPEFEFHDILSIVSSYPQVQRKLGLVLDFVMPFQDDIPDSGVLHLLPSSFGFKEETEISCPKVAYGLENESFYVRSENDSVIDRGFVSINTPAFTVTQIDADGAALKLNNMVENKIIEDAKLKIVNINLAGSKTLKAIGLPEEKSEKSGLPVIRSAGIALARNGLAEVMYFRFQKATVMHKALLSKNKLDNGLKVIIPDDSDALFADDVVQGYRMDIALSEAPDKWYSLHWKKDEYTYYDSNGQPHAIDGIVPDEGFIQIAVAEDAEGDKKLFTGEVMFRWEGWSLSVRRPGYAINEEDDEHPKDYVNTVKSVEAKKYALDKDLDFKLNAVSKIVPGTLPRLRFGQQYMIRVRTIDMAGNSRGLDEKTPDPARNMIRSFRYLRYEPTASPVVLLGNALRDGESLEHLVLRSNFDEKPKDYEQAHPLNGKTFDPQPLRYFLPPKNSQLMAETHGKFDKSFGGDEQEAKKAYQFIISREGLLEHGPDGRDKVYKPDEVKMIYLPDPMAAGVSLSAAEGYNDTHSQEFDTRLFSFFGNQEVTGKSTNIAIGDDEWHSGKPVKITIAEGRKRAEWQAGKRLLTVFLPKGERTVINFSSWWRWDDIENLSAVWDMIRHEKPANLKMLRELAFTGRHGMISPARQLELVHAVQQPVEAPEIRQMRGDRNNNQTDCHVHAQITIHGYSTLKLDLQARWKEIIDLPHDTEPEWMDRSGGINDITVNYHDKVLEKGAFAEAKSGKNDPKPIAQVYNNEKAPLTQKFPDTKHRRVSYQAVGTGRYQEYFDQLLKQDKLPVTRVSEVFKDVIIPSSARPMKPEIEYIIPIFEWRKGKTSTALRHRRLGGGLRVYLKRPWFSSGEGEKLAVVLPGRRAGQKPSMTLAAKGQGFNDKLTYWGVDPIKLSRPAEGYSPKAEHFRMNPTVDEVAYPADDKYKVKAVAYPVEFDKQRKLWYCDMAIEHDKMYYPFIKLALARYQEHSVRKNNTDVCLSEVVQADFIQLVPERTCTVRFKKDDLNTKFTVTVEGAMSLAGANYSPSNYIVISFYNTELGQPKYMLIDDSTNDKDLQKKKVVAHITEKDIKNDRFSISREFKLPKAYKKAPYIIIVEEYEKAASGTPGKLSGSKNPYAHENQPRLVYADRFDINVNPSRMKNIR